MKTKESVVAALKCNWPYFLVLIPILAAWITDSQVPTSLRSTVANVISGVMTLALVAVIQRQRRELEEVSITDKLTGVFNSRFLRIELDRHVFLAHRTHLPLSLIFVDVDDLKPVNDRYGHMAGNLILRQIAQCLVANIRQRLDLCFRFGGDEFLVLCPHADLQAASAIAERIYRIPTSEDGFIDKRITLSLGVIQLREAESPREFLERADRVMYSVKQTGKNRIGLDTMESSVRSSVLA